MSALAEPEWIELETVLRLHALHLAEHCGIPGIRDEGLLLSALNRPLAKWDYEHPHPDLCELAAAYAFGLAKNHPFLDGKNPTASEDEKYPIYLGLAAGEIEEDAFAAWLRDNTAPVS